jgi:hypothetical protein
MREQDAWPEHAEFMDGLAEDGFVGDAYQSAGKLGLAESATEETVVELRRRLNAAMASDRAPARARRALTDTLLRERRRLVSVTYWAA